MYLLSTTQPIKLLQDSPADVMFETPSGVLADYVIIKVIPAPDATEPPKISELLVVACFHPGTIYDLLTVSF